MTETVDTSAEAVDLHLCESEAAKAMGNYAYGDDAGISTRVGWQPVPTALAATAQGGE